MPNQDDDARFRPPPEAPEPALELDPEWVAQRAQKQAAAANPPKPKRQIVGVVIALVLIAAVVAAIVWIVKHK